LNFIFHNRYIYLFILSILLFSNLFSNTLPESKTDKNKILINGYITDSNKIPIKDAAVSIRVNKTEKIVYTNEIGYYEALTAYGVVIVKVSKNGFKSKGNVKRIHSEKSFESINFILDERLGTITGYLTDGVFPLPNTTVILTDSDNGLYYTSTSNADGLFIFSNLSISHFYNLYVNNEFFQPYVSKNLYVLENTNMVHNIILVRDFFNLIVEICDSNHVPIPNIEVSINNAKYTTDINGFVDTYINHSNDQIILDIFIKKFNYSETFYIIPNIDYPLKIKIILK